MGQQNIQANIKVDSKRSARKHILVATQVTVRDCFFFELGKEFKMLLRNYTDLACSVFHGATQE